MNKITSKGFVLCMPLSFVKKWKTPNPLPLCESGKPAQSLFTHELCYMAEFVKCLCCAPVEAEVQKIMLQQYGE